MSELISGKEALIALANGEEVQYREDGGEWNWDIESLVLSWVKHDHYEFRLKPRTITINGIEVPAPFLPEKDCGVFILNDGKTSGWQHYSYEVDGDNTNEFIGIWRTEEEIKQVVEALRSILKC